MVTTCQQMHEAEARLFANGTPAEPLMEKAGLACAEVIRQVQPTPAKAILYCGRGNNGGDALVVGRWLKRWGWQVEAKLSHSIDSMTELAAKKFHEFDSTQANSTTELSAPLILVDGLLGIGAKGSLRGPIGELAQQLNATRVEHNAISFAIDLPSGVDGDTGEIYQHAVVADHTLSICQPKRGLLADGAINHAGRIHSISLPEIVGVEGDDSVRLVDRNYLRSILTRRQFDTHKGQAGRVSIIAGSTGYTGAPILSALGAMYTGAGLISLWVPEAIYTIVASQAPPEIMVHSYNDWETIFSTRSDVLAIGPGMVNQPIDESKLEMVAKCETPIIIDADLLNALAKHPSYLKKLADKPHLLTPHPGEFSRLFPELEETNLNRLEKVQKVTAEKSLPILLKGARTITSAPGEQSVYNSTGTPAMASGGMGDVLTGAIAALVAGGLTSHQAGVVGSWLLGRAAELTNPSATASRVAQQLGKARQEIHRH